MRFAWLQKNASDPKAVTQAFLHPLALIRLVYNVVFWVFLLPFFTSMAYDTGFIIFTVVIAMRLLANLYINFTIYEPAAFERFPFRSPS